MRGESVISSPSNERLSKNDVILSRAAQTSTDVLVFSSLASMNKGLSGSRRELPLESSGDLHETQCKVLQYLYATHVLLCRHL